MASGGLVAVRKMTAAGHEQTYWERPEDIRKDVGGGSYKEGSAAAQKRGGDPVVMDQFFSRISGWSSQSYNNDSTVIRGAAAKLVAEAEGDDDVDYYLSREKTSVLAARHSRTGDDEYQKAVERGDFGNPAALLNKGASSERHVQTLEAMAAVSQSMYDEEEVTLYRGVGKSMGDKAVSDGKLATGALVSFSESPAQAARFARNGGVVISVRVPRSAIVASHRAFKGGDTTTGFMDGEAEVVVLTSGELYVDVHQKGVD